MKKINSLHVGFVVLLLSFFLWTFSTYRSCQEIKRKGLKNIVNEIWEGDSTKTEED